ncbi:3-hydroxyacyl-ACP dehydratase FabZ [Gemella sanguinis]|jgi:hypothetical protein|uniref:3-hydroxyacyl-[acyl-carrier-protein] dehydratase n=1 Tax=Gemella sanguinis TaxID=84135 RepID=A0A2N6SCK3_9BACL|nr:3-hydroxyacyl-ACP dehydratase FabZ [Gemella sanguinis]PMC51656.1 beta-hydroxyacyl-ACP dehydratase [Gemella sanguinis]
MINIETIMKLLPHGYPFLLVDKVISYKPGSIECRKNITINEPYFQGHFPKKPVVPGVLMIEMAAQSAGLLCILDSLGVEEINEQTDFENVTNSVGYLASVKNFKFKRLVTAGDQLKIICELQSSLRSLIRVNTIIQDENGKEVASGDMLIAKG